VTQSNEIKLENTTFKTIRFSSLRICVHPCSSVVNLPKSQKNRYNNNHATRTQHPRFIYVYLQFQFFYIYSLAGDYKLILTGYSQVSPIFRAGRLYHDRATRNIHAPVAPSDDGNDYKKCK
jgi:hypothetical protein